MVWKHKVSLRHQAKSSARSRRQLQAGITLVDRYHVQEVIGVGGMGSVYRARDLHFPNVTKLVAVKEMIEHRARSAYAADHHS